MAYTYTYTERKRIRKSFGTRENVLAIPYLLQMQKDAYTAFLQADLAPRKRAPEGLQAAFEAAFPIVSHNGFVEMKFVEYNLAKPAFDVRECQTRGLTFASAVRARVQLIIYDRESSTSQSKVVKEVKEQEVYMGEVPLMTVKGSFIINGTERVIVSQLHRSLVSSSMTRARRTARASCCSPHASSLTAVPGWISSLTPRTFCSSGWIVVARCP